MAFLDFCKEHVTDTPLKIEDVEVPERYKRPVNAMVQMMKNKKNIFDVIDVPFVEQAFKGNYEESLKEHLNDGEVPDGIIYTLSFKIFGEVPSRLSKDQMAIIKILSTYICIQS